MELELPSLCPQLQKVILLLFWEGTDTAQFE